MISIVEASTVYAGYLPDLPDVVLIRRPLALRSASLLLGQYAVQVCETPAELLAVQRWLAASPKMVRRPDGSQALDLRGPLGPSRATGSAWCAGWLAPEPGWPWLVVVRSPVALPEHARGRYATDAFEDEEKWLAHLAKLRASAPGILVRVPDPSAAH